MDFGAADLVACWDDDWRPRWRVDLSPSYKAHRVERHVADGPDIEAVPAGLVVQVPLIRHVLDLAGIAVVGAPEHETDDVIGSYAVHAALPVDVVTGDRDLFQVVDDARDVRVVYTARGMRNLETVTDAVGVGRYRALPQQYADYAVLRGDTSDGLPGVAGIGEKSAAALLGRFGTLEGLREAAEDPESGLPVLMRAKLTAAADYFQMAPAVVDVVRDLDLPALDAAGARLNAADGGPRLELERLASAWNLDGSVKRLFAALDRHG